MNSKYYSDPQEALNVFIETFQEAVTDPLISDIVGKLNQLIYFDYTEDDPIISYYVDTRAGTIKIGPGKPSEKPDVTIINSVDIAHQAWSNKLSPAVAMAMGKIKAKGSITALLKLTPLLKNICSHYNLVLDRRGLSGIKL